MARAGDTAATAVVVLNPACSPGPMEEATTEDEQAAAVLEEMRDAAAVGGLRSYEVQRRGEDAFLACMNICLSQFMSFLRRL